jgi:hypothetical protein
MRADTVQILKRFFFCERSLPRFIWQNAQTAHALRERVFELRFPSRVMEEEGLEAALVALFRAAKNAPSVRAFLLSVGRSLLPALSDGYRAFLEESDRVADGPTHRFLSQALLEKEEQVRTVSHWAEEAFAESPESPNAAIEWNEAVAQRLSVLGGVGIGSPTPKLTPSWSNGVARFHSSPRRVMRRASYMTPRAHQICCELTSDSQQTKTSLNDAFANEIALRSSHYLAENRRD